MTLDLTWDYLVRIFLGSIGFLRLFAWLAIWLFKLPTLPIIVFGWAWTIIMEIMIFPFSGWMIFFGGSGCFLRWGHNCNWPNGKRLKDRSYWEVADLAWLMKSPSKNELNAELMKIEGQNRRKALMKASPLYK